MNEAEQIQNPRRWEVIDCHSCGMGFTPWRTQDECPEDPWECASCKDEANFQSQIDDAWAKVGEVTRERDELRIQLAEAIGLLATADLSEEAPEWDERRRELLSRLRMSPT